MPTLKELFVTAVAIHACNKDKVYYMMKHKGRIAWRTVDQIDDCANMMSFVNSESFTLKTLKDLIKCLQNRSPVQFGKYLVQHLPKDVEYLQISTFMPTIEDGKMWTHELEWFDLDVVPYGK